MGRRRNLMRSRTLFAAFVAAPAAASALLFGAAPSLAQETQQAGVSGSLERFEPAPAGDAMFSVPSPWTRGHLTPNASAIFDFAYRPLSIEEGSTRRAVVSQQFFLHLNASLALFDRLLVSLDMPFALAQGGDSPTVAGVRLASPEGADVGDLRFGARVRLYGGPEEPFQIAAGGYLYAPTGPDGSFAGDGSIRGAPQVVVGGAYGRFLYSGSLGTTLRASSHAHSFDARVGAALLADNFLQVGTELSISAPLSNESLVATESARIDLASPVSAELLLGVKARFMRFLVAGVGVGPGLSQGYGTPVVFMVGSIGYEPIQPKIVAGDADEDGIADPADACPNERGVKSADPKKNGCPLDVDSDGIADTDDACPKDPGVKSADPKKNGCPADADGDSIADAADACPKAPGPKSEDPKKNGCPVGADTDKDGIEDAADACPKDAGAKSEDPKKNGCPPDRDDDGVPDAVDACPDVRGGPDTDPKQHGCPHVTVTQTEIVILRQVKFRVAQLTLDQTVDPVSDDLLTEVRNAILDHPEIELIEVQGHADNTGPEDFNQRLSQGRADAVRLWLIKRGISRKKLIAKGYGSTNPVASNDTEEGRQANRRVQFVIAKKKAP
jgi:OOP family OmpA-OmpF porin